MTKTQYYTATTLDGFIADEDNSLDWLFVVDRGPNPDNEFAKFMADVGAITMGATTYEWSLANHNLLDNPDWWRSFYGDRPCWVFTHRDLPVAPGANLRFVRGEVEPVHAEMTEAADGKNIWVVGGGDLVGQFDDHGLLDELIVGIAPVTLGGGAPLLPRRITSSRLELIEAEQVGQFARLVYRVGS